MRLETEDDICRLIEADSWMMSVLLHARSLNLPDSWVCAGFIRSKVWDAIHGYRHRTPLSDVDVVYFDRANVEETTEKELEARLRKSAPDVPWSVKNQARMHVINGIAPYESSYDAVSHFPETATAVAARLSTGDEVELMAPWGVADLVRCVVRPTPYFVKGGENLQMTYKARVASKHWDKTWPRVRTVRFAWACNERIKTSKRSDQS